MMVLCSLVRRACTGAMHTQTWKVLAYLKMCPSTYPPMLVDGTLLVISTPLVVIV